MCQSQSNVSAVLKGFDSYPDSANVRISVVASLYACSHATIWRAVKAGIIPKPRRLTPGITCWNVGELRAALAAEGKTGGAQ